MCVGGKSGANRLVIPANAGIQLGDPIDPKKLDARLRGHNKEKLNRNIDVLTQPARRLCRCRLLDRLWRGGLLERQGRKSRCDPAGLFQRGGEARLLRRLWHLQPGARLTGGLLGGDQRGADLHPATLPKQG
jgi:hypothetical protein